MVEPPGGSRRRGETLDAALLDAAWDELIAVGYGRVTMAGVAARAGTAKAVLYRRWPNRTELLGAAIDRRVPRLDGEPPDTGDLRTDLIAVLRGLDGRYRAVVEVPDPDGELTGQLLRQAAYTGIGRLAAVLRRAVERGELAPAGQLPRIVRLTVGLLGQERRLDPPPEDAADLVERIVDDYCLPLLRFHAAPPG
jgi:AcrR family transcriptional regulator